MSKLPHIPLYVGDWVKDCATLSLESEAAWLRIVLDLWTKGKQSQSKYTTKALQNLWRCSTEKVEEIVEELIDNNIAEISQEGRFYLITCRRFARENELSQIRSEAGKQGAKAKQNKSKLKANIKQTHDNDNDNDNIKGEESQERRGFSAIEKIVIFCGGLSGNKWDPKAKAWQPNIKKRLKEGRTPDELCEVARKAWLFKYKGSDFERHFNPEIVFRDSLFGKHEALIPPKNQQSNKNQYDAENIK